MTDVEVLPPSYTFGKVVGRVIQAIADTADDVDDKPQARAAAGTVTFTPTETLRKVADDGTGTGVFVASGPVQASLSSTGRILDAEGRQGIWLVTGTYTVSFKFTPPAGMPSPKITPFTIAVTADNDDTTPLDLATAAPPEPGDGVTVITYTLPSGGTTGQVMTKTSTGAAWSDATGGTGGGAVDSVNGQTGTVVLAAADVGADASGAAAAAQAAAEAAIPAPSNGNPSLLGTTAPGTGTAYSRWDHIHKLPSASDVGAATTAQGTLADSAVQPGDLATVATTGDYTDLVNTPSTPGSDPSVIYLEADPTGVTPIDTAFAAALAALPTMTDPQDTTGHKRGTIVLPGGTLRVNAPLPNVGPYVSVIGQGYWQTILDFHGTGTCLYVHSETFPPSGSIGFMSLDWAGALVGGFGIDGTNSGAGSVGLDYGDLEGGNVDVMVQNFTGAGSLGVRFSNDVWWTEKIKGRVIVKNCAQSVVFRQNPGSGTAGTSFAYNNIEITQMLQGDQQGVEFKNGARYYHGRLRIDGNMVKGTTTKWALTLGSAVELTGRLDMMVEAQGATGTAPRTISVSGTSGTIYANGVLSFRGGFNASTFDPTSMAFDFNGVIVGDTNLNPSDNPGPIHVGGGVQSRGTINTSTGVISWPSGDLFDLTLTANLTMSAAANVGLWSRRVLVVHQAASGGPYTVTWPTGWVWSGGTAPTMPTTAGAVLVVTLQAMGSTTVYASAAVASAGTATSLVAGTATSTATLTVDANTYNGYSLTAQAAALTVAAPIGAPAAMQPLLLRFKDNGTAQTITWNAAFRAVGVTLPTTTTISKTLYVMCAWNAADSKWDAIGVTQEA